MKTKKFQTLCEEILFPHIDAQLRTECQKLEDMLAVMSAAIGRLEVFVDDMRVDEFQVSDEAS